MIRSIKKKLGYALNIRKSFDQYLKDNRLEMKTLNKNLTALKSSMEKIEESTIQYDLKKLYFIYFITKQNKDKMIQSFQYNKDKVKGKFIFIDLENLLENKFNDNIQIIKENISIKELIVMLSGEYFILINTPTYFNNNFNDTFDKISDDYEIIFTQVQSYEELRLKNHDNKLFDFKGKEVIKNLKTVKNWCKFNLSGVFLRIDPISSYYYEDVYIDEVEDKSMFFMLILSCLIYKNSIALVTKNIILKQDNILYNKPNEHIYVDELSKIYNIVNYYKVDEFKFLLLNYLGENIKKFESEKIYLTNTLVKQRNLNIKNFFNIIDFNLIVENYNIFWKKYQIGFNYMFYNGIHEEAQAGAYFKNEGNNYIKIKLISLEDKWSFLINNKVYTLEDFNYKIINETFNNEKFVDNIYVKIPVNIEDFQEVRFKNKKVPLRNFPRASKGKQTFSNSSKLLFIDRINKADDNAEALYRYFLKNNLNEGNKFFVLSKGCKDWERLKNDGFNLIDYGSKDFEDLYKSANFILSSGINPDEIENYKKLRYPKIEAKGKFIFLQHGIITDDMRLFFKEKSIDLFITGAKYEYSNIKEKYTFFDNEVGYTGLARYDNYQNIEKGDSIIIHFTWRRALKGMSEENFKKTEYFQDILNLLTNNTLLQKLESSKYSIKYILHPELSTTYYSLFKSLENKKIKIYKNTDINYRTLIEKTSACVITDYSSIFTDFSYCGKKVIYFQKDKMDFFNRHTYKEEMDYSLDGLGDVHTNLESLLQDIINSIDNKFVVQKDYADKVEDFFGFKKSNSCENIYKLLKERY